MKILENTFKILVIIVVLLNAAFLFSQVRVTAAQDVKLALMEDDHGNKPFTPDFFIKATFENGNIPKWYGYPVVSGKYEYAHLSSGSFYRYGWEVGYTFPILKAKNGVFMARDLLHVTPTVGNGILKRRLLPAMGSWEFGLETNLLLTEMLYLNLTVTYTERPEWDMYRENVYAGIGIKI